MSKIESKGSASIPALAVESQSIPFSSVAANLEEEEFAGKPRTASFPSWSYAHGASRPRIRRINGKRIPRAHGSSATDLSIGALSHIPSRMDAFGYDSHSTGNDFERARRRKTNLFTRRSPYALTRTSIVICLNA